jgi:hypothetical protein
MTVFRRAAPWCFAASLALGCGSSSKTSYGNDANLPDSTGAAGATVEAGGEAGGEAAAGTGVPGAPDAGDASNDDVAAVVDAAPPEDATPDATDATRDVASPEDAPDASGAAGAPAPQACVLGSATIGACVFE